MNVTDANEIIFRAKSKHQKDDCIACKERKASLEAVALLEGESFAEIRCCDNEMCKE